MKKLYIGVDIGKNGAIAKLTEDNQLTYHALPQTGGQISLKGIVDIFEEVEIWLKSDKDNHLLVGLEDVHSIFGSSAKSNFQFGRALGIIEGIVSHARMSFVMVQPKTWQKFSFLGVPEVRKNVTSTSKGSVDTKAMALIASQRLFPTQTFLATSRSRVPHDGIVDATLITYYLKNNR